MFKLEKPFRLLSKGALAATIGFCMLTPTFTPFQDKLVVAAEMKEVNVEELANVFLQKVLKQNYEEVLQMTSEGFQSLVTKDYLAMLFASVVTLKDEFVKPVNVETVTNQVHTIVTQTYQTIAGPLNVIVHFDQKGKVDDFNITQASPKLPYQPPSYDNPDSYTETPIKIGKEPYELSGTLTVPTGEGSFPLVVFVHGSGPHDQDSSHYSLKPFRDLAVGLANEGIASIRYDKRTKLHPIKSSINPTFSIYEETVEDALFAADFARTLENINHEEIYIVGHSQGGFALPKIIEADKNGVVKGGISLAAPNQKLHTLLIWQLENQMKAIEESPQPNELLIQQLTAQINIFKQLDDPQYSVENLAPNLEYWWHDLKDYVPAQLAKEQTVPMLFLQGNKDFQVPGAELESWKKDLANRDNVQYKLYPNMTHFLFNYDGTPTVTGEEYALPVHVELELIQDIAKWVKTGTLVDTSEAAEPFYWDSMLVKEGQIGRITIEKPINLWTRDEEGKLVYVRTLQPGERYRVYGMDSKFGGQFDVGVNHWVTNIQGYLKYEEVPSNLK